MRVARTDPDPQLRAVAADALGEIGGPAAIAALDQAARTDLSVEVRIAAVAAIADAGSPAGGRALRALAEEEGDARVRAAAVEGWGHRDPAAIAALLDRELPEEALDAVLETFADEGEAENLRRAALEHPEARVRIRAVELLAEADAAEAPGVLARVIASDHRSDVRIAAIEALEDSENPQALTALRQLARDGG